MSNPNEIEDVFANSEEDIDIENMLNDMISNNTRQKVDDVEERPIDVIPDIPDTLAEPEQKESPLEKMRKAKEKNADIGGGIVYTNRELEEGNAEVQITDGVMTEEKMDQFTSVIDGIDSTLEKRKRLVLINRPTNQFEYMQMMTEIDYVSVDSNGNTIFNLPNGEESKFFRIRTKEDGEFTNEEMRDLATEEELADEAKAKGLNEPIKKEESKEEKTEETSAESSDDDIKNTVQIIIDKTGLGANIDFTEEEKEKIIKSDVLQINEVTKLDINAIRDKKTTKSFQDVIKERDYSGARTTICFPASGFSAQMKSMTYGEYSDVALSMENITTDIYYKRLSVIYNKMTNISTGPFKDFDDFLKNFAYSDIPLAIYGLFVSTEQEEQSVGLRCGKSDCGKEFDWKYSSRSILSLNKCAPHLLKKIEEIATADPGSYESIKEKSIVQSPYFIELPYSKFIVELGIVSAYSFLYNFIPLMDEDNYKAIFGDGFNPNYLDNLSLLQYVSAIHIPDGDGSYAHATTYKEILDTIYKISPKEIAILNTYATKINENYQIVFSIDNVVCPHCKHVTESIAVDIDDMVFRRYQQLRNIDINLKTVQDL